MLKGFGLLLGLTLGLAGCGTAHPLKVANVPVPGGLLADPAVISAFGPCSPLVQPLPAIAPASFAGGPSVSADGRWIAYQVWQFGSTDIQLLDALTGMIDPLPSLNSSAEEVAPILSPDGQWITFTSNRNGLWDVFMYDRLSGGNRPLSFNSYVAGRLAPYAFGWSGGRYW